MLTIEQAIRTNFYKLTAPFWHMEKEAQHIIEVLEQTLAALKGKDTIKLKELSNQTIHNASIFQDPGNISVAVLVYTFSKLIEREDYTRIKKWDIFLKKIDMFFSLAISALKQDNFNKYEDYLAQARKSINSLSVNLKPYIEEVIRKASINKGSKIYEHGISLGQTAKILGITEWELSEYTGQTNTPDLEYNRTLDTKKRAMMALEFFS